MKQQHYWMGRPLSDLSHEELVGVIDYLGERLQQYETPAARQALAMGQVEMMKRSPPPPVSSQDGEGG